MSAPNRPFSASPKLILAIVGFWALFTSIALPVTGISQWVKTGELDLTHQVVWEVSWFFWAPLSLLVLRICRAYPLTRTAALKGVIRLGFFGVLIVLLQLTLECTVNPLLAIVLQGEEFSWKRIIFIATYKSHAYYAVYWMIVGAAHAVEYHRRYRESEINSSRLEAKLAQAELSRLKMQLQPHFLFNTHHSIISLMMSKQSQEAIRMLTRLSDLLRVSLAHSGQQIVRLGDELDTLNLYLDIQRERFRDRLEFKISVPHALRDAEFPHLLLQPLVENSLKHGLESASESGEVGISVRHEASRLVCEVWDNGAGFNSQKEASPARKDDGVGLANSRARLQSLYGEDQSLTVLSEPGKGCRVIIILPYRDFRKGEQK